MTWEKFATVLGVFAGYLLFYGISKFISVRIKENPNKMALSFGIQVLQAFALVAALVYICMQFEATKAIYTSVLTNISLIVVVLGFAAQESIKNILSGIMIVRSKPFNIGQRVVISEKNITGVIKEITPRHTVIQKFNNTTIIVPNSIMNNSIVENAAYHGDTTISNFFDVQVAYESDVEKAMEIIKEIVVNHPLFIEGKDPCVTVRNLAAEGYDVRATVWTKTLSDNFQACSDIRIQAKKAFDENNIEIPYNHMNILTR